MPSIRSFIAFTPPPKVVDDINSLQEYLKQSQAEVKWEPRGNLHATITFLGNVEESQVEAVLATITKCSRSIPRFTVRYAEVGLVPDRMHPRIIWLGCEERTGKLQSFKRDLDQALAPLGFEAEQRSFRPHVTLGRIKDQKGILNLLSIMENRIFEPRVAVVEEILVMKSVLRTGGADYSIVQSIQLPST